MKKKKLTWEKRSTQSGQKTLPLEGKILDVVVTIAVADRAQFAQFKTMLQTPMKSNTIPFSVYFLLKAEQKGINSSPCLKQSNLLQFSPCPSQNDFSLHLLRTLSVKTNQKTKIFSTSLGPSFIPFSKFSCNYLYVDHHVPLPHL